MHLQPIANNQNALHLDNGTTVFFSYSTPVAAYDSHLNEYIKTKKKWSVTTSRHISRWLDGVEAQAVDQCILDQLAMAAWTVKAGGQVQILAHALPLTESG